MSNNKTNYSFATKLYLSLCVDAMFSLMTNDEKVEQEIVKVIEPILEDLFSEAEILA